MEIRKLIMLTLVFLVVGFAVVATNLIINGTSMFGTNIDDFDVYFSEAIIDGEDYTNEVISEDKKTINFNIDEFKYAGDTSTLEYEVTNASTSYDAEVIVECEGQTEEIIVTQNPSEQIIKAREVGNGTVTITLNKKVIEEKEIEYTCRLVVNAIERESITNTELVLEDKYVIYGTFEDSNGEALANANLVIYSEEPHYVTTDEEGYLFYNGIEKGAHEIYYLNDTLENIKNMTKKQVIENSISSANFTTKSTVSVVFNNNMKVIDLEIMEVTPFCESLVGKEWEYDYTGGEQDFLTYCDGSYKIELWGASGGDMFCNFSGRGGLGGYINGLINFSGNEKFYINVGGVGLGYCFTGSDTLLNSGGFNGGGTCYGGASGGGGATDIRLISGISFESLKSRIAVAGGGGGSNDSTHGGASGGLSSYAGTGTNSGGSASQILGGTSAKAPGSFGFGGSITYSAQTGSSDCANGDGGAGGGGYYGGGKGTTCNAGGGGGTSFISGHNGCNAIAENSTSTNIIHTGQANHYSGYKFTNTVMIDGTGYSWTNVKGSTVVGMPTHDGTGTMTGNSGNGYAKITFVSFDDSK